MELEEFFSQLSSSRPAAFNPHQCQDRPFLREEVRQAASLGLRIYPVSVLAKLKNPDSLIGEATCEITRLEELATEYGSPCREWRVRVDPSLCVLRVDGQVGRNSVSVLSQHDQEEHDTPQAYRGDTVWTFFRKPKGMLRRASVRKLASGVSLLSDGDSCPVPVSSERNSDIRAIPNWLRELAFEAPDTSPGTSAPVPASSPRPVPCRPAAHFLKPRKGARKCYPGCDHAGWRRGISRRR